MGNRKISQTQLISIGACYLLGTIIISVFISSVSLGESWLSGIVGGICFIPVLLIFFGLAKRYPGKNLFQINEAVFGPVGGRILSGVYLLFFLSLCALSLLEVSEFLHYFIMPDTPLVVIAAFLMIACVYCVKKGLAPIAQVSAIFGLLALAGLLFNILLSARHANPEHLLPIFALKPLDYIQSTHVAVSIPFGESIILFMFLPDLSEKASVKKVYIAVTLFTVLIMTVIHLREVVSLGPMIAYTTQPSYESVRMINIDNILTRIESLFGFLLVSLTFFKTLILFYVCGVSVQQIFRLESYRPLVLMLAALLTVYAVKAYGSPTSTIYWGKNVSPFIWSFFTFILPLLMLAVSMAKGLLSKKRKGMARP